MAETETIAKRLTELRAKLDERAGAITDPEHADRAITMQALSLLAEGVSKLTRDMRELKGARKGKAAGGAKAAGETAGAAKAAGAKTGAGKAGAATAAGAGAKAAGARKAGAGKGKAAGKGAKQGPKKRKAAEGGAPA